MVPKTVVCFSGWSNTGKTTFIERTLAALAARGIPCGALKRMKHSGSFQVPGKDSARFFAAGAESALVGGPETVLTIRSPESLDSAFLDRLFPGARVVLVEGDEVRGALRVLTAGRAETEAELKMPVAAADVLITADPGLAEKAVQAGALSLGPDDIERFIALLEDQMEREVSVTCGDKPVPMNPFVKTIVRDVSLAVVNSLKKVEPGEEIVIRIAAVK